MTICVKLISCNNDLSSINDYLIEVDSINAPDSVISDKPFDVIFFGIVGLNTCQMFKTFNISYNDNDVNIEAWGTDNSNGNGYVGEAFVGEDITIVKHIIVK